MIRRTSKSDLLTHCSSDGHFSSFFMSFGFANFFVRRGDNKNLKKEANESWWETIEKQFVTWFFHSTEDEKIKKNRDKLIDTLTQKMEKDPFVSCIKSRWQSFHLKFQVENKALRVQKSHTHAIIATWVYCGSGKVQLRAFTPLGGSFNCSLFVLSIFFVFDNSAQSWKNPFKLLNEF